MNGTRLTCFILSVNLEQAQDTEITNILTCIISSVFCLTAIMGNSVILHVIRKTPQFHSPPFAFLFGLAASDLVVGLICRQFFEAFKIAELGSNFATYCTLRMIQRLSSWRIFVNFEWCFCRSTSRFNPSFTLQHGCYYSLRLSDHCVPVDLCHNCGYIEILDEQVDYRSGCDIASVISCYNP